MEASWSTAVFIKVFIQLTIYCILAIPLVDPPLGNFVSLRNSSTPRETLMNTAALRRKGKVTIPGLFIAFSPEGKLFEAREVFGDFDGPLSSFEQLSFWGKCDEKSWDSNFTLSSLPWSRKDIDHLLQVP
jgi:hypothetical protein